MRLLTILTIGVAGAAWGFWNLFTQDNEEHRRGRWGTVGGQHNRYTGWFHDDKAADPPDTWWRRYQRATWLGLGGSESKFHAALNGLVEWTRADPQRAAKVLALMLVASWVLLIIGWSV